jgi:DNA polymerase-3 subunit alpha
VPDEETGEAKAENGKWVTVGGIIADKTLKYTKNNQTMAFVTVEDLMGSVEVLVFPKPFEKYRDKLEVDRKVLIEGRVSAEDERASKLIADKIITFEEIPKDVWLAFADKETWNAYAPELTELLSAVQRGNDRVIVFIRNPKQMKDLTGRGKISASPELLESFMKICGEENVAVRASKQTREN